jgi:hypothetical protein
LTQGAADGAAQVWKVAAMFGDGVPEMIVEMDGIALTGRWCIVGLGRDSSMIC